MSGEDSEPKRPEKESGTAGPPIELDPAKTHIIAEWKYTSPLICCRFEPQGRYLFSSAEDNQVQRWEFNSGKLTTLEAHDSWVRDLVCLPDGQTLVTAGCDEQMMFWPIADEQPRPTHQIKAHHGWIRCIDASPDGLMLASGGNDNLVKLWDAADGTQLRVLEGHDSHVYSVMFHPSGKFVLSGDLSGQIKQWEIETGREIRSFDAKELHSYNKGQKVHYGGVRSLALSPDARHLACGGLHKASNPLGAVNEPLVVVFEWESAKQVRSLVSKGVRGVIWRSLYLADGTLLGASGGAGGGFLLFWNAADDESFHKFKLKDTARSLDLHPDQLHVATTHWDRHVRVSRIAAALPTADAKGDG